MTSADSMTTEKKTEGPTLSTGQVAKKLGVCRETIRRRIVAGHIPAIQLSPEGPYRVSRAWVLAQLAALEGEK